MGSVEELESRLPENSKVAPSLANSVLIANTYGVKVASETALRLRRASFISLTPGAPQSPSRRAYAPAEDRHWVRERLGASYRAHVGVATTVPKTVPTRPPNQTIGDQRRRLKCEKSGRKTRDLVGWGWCGED